MDNAYRNVAVEADIARDLQVDLETARQCFQEMLTYLDAYWQQGVVRSPSLRVDHAWHAFILHTRSYMTYCNERYGTYLHHLPDEREDLDVQLAHCVPYTPDLEMPLVADRHR